MNWGTEWFLGAKKRKSRGQLGIRVKGEQNKVQRLMSNSGEKLRKNEEEEEKSKLKGKKWGGGGGEEYRRSNGQMAQEPTPWWARSVTFSWSKVILTFWKWRKIKFKRNSQGSQIQGRRRTNRAEVASRDPTRMQHPVKAKPRGGQCSVLNVSKENWGKINKFLHLKSVAQWPKSNRMRGISFGDHCKGNHSLMLFLLGKYRLKKTTN